MQIEFFLPMIPPTITHQQKQVHVVHGKPVFYEPEELKAARSLFTDAVGRYAPEQPFDGPVQLITKWIWAEEYTGQMSFADVWRWKTTKPDTDNMIKLLKDCMTRVGFWKDDSQVASEITEKFLADKPGIYVKVVEL